MLMLVTQTSVIANLNCYWLYSRQPKYWQYFILHYCCKIQTSSYI